ncbi:putative leucine-rich repeat domain, L domain-containing protein [Rosa chinensis]|nr:putative leucine-rich repeat domain, L domain-containing protein [Rosa chinensis]
MTHTRTLLVFRQTANRSELHMVLKACKLLRVFGLQGVPELVNFPESVISLTLLRYLSVRQTNIESVPRSIEKLGLLETLELKDTLVTNLPKGIGKLHHLRHLLVYCNAVNNNMMFGAAQGVEFSTSKISALSISNSLQKLSLIKVNTNKKFLKALGELKDLRRLGLVDLHREDGRELCCTIQKMDDLSTLDVRATSEDEYLDLDHMQSGSPPLLLQHLYLKGRLKRVPEWIPKLTSLKKIGLKWSKMDADAEPLTALQDLPNLMELDLVDYYTGQVLGFGDETFKKLVALSIDKFDKLNLISIGEKAMPMLKKLTISRCPDLKLLPFSSGDLELLEELLLFDMPNEFIAEFETDSERREDLKHVGVIHYSRHPGSYQSDGFKDLSPSKWR